MKHCWKQVSKVSNHGFASATHRSATERFTIDYECMKCGARFMTKRDKRDLHEKVSAVEWKAHGILECDAELVRQLHSA